MSEWGEDDKPCQWSGLQKICKNCEFGTCDYTTSQHYCLRVNGLRMVLFGPRPVAPTDTCKHFALYKKLKGLSR